MEGENRTLNDLSADILLFFWLMNRPFPRWLLWAVCPKLREKLTAQKEQQNDNGEMD